MLQHLIFIGSGGPIYIKPKQSKDGRGQLGGNNKWRPYSVVLLVLLVKEKSKNIKI